MIDARAIEYDCVVSESSGASEPIVISVKAVADGQVFAAFAKLSIMLPLSTKAYTIEAIASMLANDLEIFTPDPCIVNFSDEFIDSVHEKKIQDRMQKSSKTVFATKKLPSGFFDVPNSNYPLAGDALRQAANIFALDAAIENLDRGGSGKPNCMTDGKLFAAIDHEKAFPQVVGIPLIGVPKPKKPWELGGLEHYRRPDSHLFINQLVKNSAKIDLGDFSKAWQFVTDERIQAYGETLPDAWLGDSACVKQILHHIKEVRNNAGSMVTEIYRVLGKK